MADGASLILDVGPVEEVEYAEAEDEPRYAEGFLRPHELLAVGAVGLQRRLMADGASPLLGNEPVEEVGYDEPRDDEPHGQGQPDKDVIYAVEGLLRPHQLVTVRAVEPHPPRWGHIIPTEKIKERRRPNIHWSGHASLSDPQNEYIMGDISDGFLLSSEIIEKNNEVRNRFITQFQIYSTKRSFFSRCVNCLR